MSEQHPLHQVSSVAQQQQVINSVFLPRIRFKNVEFDPELTLLGFELSSRPPAAELINTFNKFLPKHTPYKAVHLFTIPNQPTTVIAKLAPA